MTRRHALLGPGGCAVRARLILVVRCALPGFSVLADRQTRHFAKLLLVDTALKDRRIPEATQCVPLDRFVLGTNCCLNHALVHLETTVQVCTSADNISFVLWNYHDENHI